MKHIREIGIALLVVFVFISILIMTDYFGNSNQGQIKEYVCSDNGIIVNDPSECENMPMWKICQAQGKGYSSTSNRCTSATPELN